MKKITSLLFVLLSISSFAQIPNPSFETWSGSTPTGWFNVTSSLTGSVTQSTNAYAGSYAVQINAVNSSGFYIGGELVTNDLEGYFSNSGNPVALNGWYISNLSGGDELEIGGSTKCSNDSSNGSAVFFVTTNTTVYKSFSACFYYAKKCTSDSAFVSLYLANTSGTVHAGSYVIVDDLSFGPCATGIDEVQKNVTVEAAYPVPANTFSNIIYSIPGVSNVSVTLYDLTGKKVKDILEKTQQSPGKYKIPVNVTDLASGVYIYTIVVDGVPYSQKLTVAK